MREFSDPNAAAVSGGWPFRPLKKPIVFQEDHVRPESEASGQWLGITSSLQGETRISWPVDFPDPPSSGEAKL